MKITKYFKNEAELKEYFPNGVSANVLAFVKDEFGRDVLYTSTNNIPGSPEAAPTGGYIDSPETTTELVQATDISNSIVG